MTDSMPHKDSQVSRAHRCGLRTAEMGSQTLHLLSLFWHYTRVKEQDISPLIYLNFLCYFAMGLAVRSTSLVDQRINNSLFLDFDSLVPLLRNSTAKHKTKDKQTLNKFWAPSCSGFGHPVVVSVRCSLLPFPFERFGARKPMGVAFLSERRSLI